MTARSALRSWFEPRRRAYPWRGVRDPYRILVSEVMLQQTQASRVVAPYTAFIRLFPSVRTLAEASRADVLRAWAGLGYNRRAVALSEAARAVVRDHGGLIPSDPDELVHLPGVGPYTAAAMASIVFGVPVPAVDTNLGRVVSRAVLGVDRAEPARVRRAAEAWLDRADPGSWNQAIMDLGREVCRPVPRCASCPLAEACRFRLSGRRPGRAGGRVTPFEGSSRQLRGAVIEILRDRRTATVEALARSSGRGLQQVAEVVVALHADGLVRAGPSALAGRPTGRVRLGE